MKKISVLLSGLFLLMCIPLTGCSDTVTSETKREKISIVSTVFPGYDFARQIAGDHAELTLLLPPEADSHSYEPSGKDIIKIQNSDLFIYIGSEADQWVETVLASLEYPIQTFRLMDQVELLTEEWIQGMEPSDDHDHDDHDDHDDDDHTHEHDASEYDQHVWTSPRNAMQITRNLAKVMGETDPDHSQVYHQHAEESVQQLKQLDQQFTDLFDTVSNTTLVFGDRFPMRYFVDAYGLDYYAAFSGCSTDTEASPGTIAFLIDRIKEQSISTIFYLEFSNQNIANSIAEQTGASTAQFHSAHNVSKDDLQNGVTYLSLMQQNLKTLQEALQ